MGTGTTNWRGCKMFTVTRTIHEIAVRTSRLGVEETRQLMVTWGFLLPHHTTWRGRQLAAAIEQYSCHPQALADAHILRQADQSQA